MGIRHLLKIYDKYSVAVTGSKGTGKDVLMGNVIARRKKPYHSNMDYTNDERYKPLELDKLDCGGNTYKEFISGELKPYKYPYPDEEDIYISDCGVYFPSQYNGELNARYKYFPTFMALSRQLGECYIHTNCQNFNRVWDKIREMNDYYIRTNWCKVFFGKIVIMSYTEYDRAQSCQDRIKPQKIEKSGLLTKKRDRLTESIARDNFCNTYGLVRDRLLICWNKSKHDTRRFKEIIANANNK